MIPYYIITLAVTSIVAFIKPQIGNKNKYKVAAVFIILFVFAAIRGNGNGDYFAYIDRGRYLYSWHDVLYKNVGMEVGYKFLAYIVRLLSMPSQAVVVIMNLISLICICFFIVHSSYDWSLSLLLYLPLYFQFDLHATRTAVAIGLSAIGYLALQDKRYLKFVFFVLLASTFHTVALISFLMFFFRKVKLNLFISIGVLLGDALFSKAIGVTGILGALGALGFNYGIDKYNTYAQDVDYGYAASLLDPRLLMAVALFIIYALFVVKDDDKDNFNANGTFLYAFIFILFSEQTFIAYRLSAFFYVSIVSLIPSIVRKFYIADQDKSKLILLYYIVVILGTVLNLIYARMGVDYKTVFETQKGLMRF